MTLSKANEFQQAFLNSLRSTDVHAVARRFTTSLLEYVRAAAVFSATTVATLPSVIVANTTRGGVLWTLAFVAAVTGPSLCTSSDPRVVRLRNRLQGYWRNHKVRMPLVGAGCWVFVRVLHRAGVVLLLEVAALAVTVNYVVRQEQKSLNRQQMDIQRLLAQPEACTAVLGPHLPRWIAFPNVQKAEWLNTIIAGLWPSLSDATASVVKESLARILKAKKPSFLTRLELVNFTIGSKPISVDGVQHHQITTTETVLDLHLSWRSNNFDIKFAAGVSPLVVVEASVTDVTCRCVCRVTLGPHLPHFPCLGAVSVSLLGTPDISFSLKAAKLSLDAIPGLGQFIDDLIRNVLIGSMVYPRQMIFAVDKTFDLSQHGAAFDHRAKALGKLRVLVHEARNVAASGSVVGMVGLGASTYYVEVGFVDASTTNLRKKTSPQGLKESTAAFSKESSNFMFTIHDNTAMIGVWLYRAEFPSPKLLGERAFPISEFLRAAWNEHPVQLKHPKGKECNAVVVLSCRYSGFTTENGSAMSGVMKSDASFAPSSSMAQASGRPRGATMRAAPPPKTVPTRVSGSCPATPPSSRHSTSSRSTTARDYTTRGTLFILLDRCKGLKNVELIGTSDPYVVFSVGSRTVKTPVVDDCLDPVFNFEAELEVDDVFASTLDLKIFDENVTKDELMARLTIDLNDVVQSNCQMAKHTWNLVPQGTITMTLTLRLETD